MQVEILQNPDKKTFASGDFRLEENRLVDNSSGREINIDDLPQDIVVNIAGTKNFLHYVRKTDQLRVGCIVMYAKDWMGKYEMGPVYGYTQQQVDEYMPYIRFIKALSDRRTQNDTNQSVESSGDSEE